MITRNRTRTVLTLVAVAMAIVVTTTHQVSAAELTHEATVEVSDDHSVFNVSVFPGKAGYDDGTDSGVFGDGTVVDYRFFNSLVTTFNGTGYADGGAGLVSEATATNSNNTNGGALDWSDVWTTNDPGINFSGSANFTSDTFARSQGVSGTIDISGLQSGTLYFIYGTYYNPNTVSLTMTGSGQPTVNAQHVEDPPNTTNKAFVTEFSFADASLYDQISYTYTNTDTDASRARFMGVIVDGAVTDPMNSSDPSPDNGATDVPPDVVLSWEPGKYAAPTNGHKVYFGESFDDVNDATGGVAQSAASYTLPRLDFGTTYYWRIDEVNAPPTSHIEFKGNVWSFTTEPVGYPIAGENITATASSTHLADTGTENTINGSGLDVNDLHSTEATDMWLSSDEPNGAWIEYELDKVHKLHEMWAWNHNGTMEPVLGFGLKDVTIEYSTNGTDYTTLGTTHEFVRASGEDGYEHNTTVDFGGAAAKYVRLTANSNWGGLLDQYGLSEVRFFSIPVFAKEPSPDSGTTDVAVDVTLGFSAGREAVTHDVYLSSDEQAVIDGNVPVTTVTEAGYGPLSLDLGTTYYWKINEVNEAETPTTWQGEIWNFSTPEFFVVEDFEDYNDWPPDEIWSTWVDGYGVPANGATVGHPAPDWNLDEHYVETAIVHGGDQSMPLFYDNSTAGYSEATVNVANLQVGQDWTKHGIKALTLRFFGDPNNAVEQMYVKVNGSKVTYGGDAENIRRTGWQMWYIDLADFGPDLSNVTELSIGFERSGTFGGQGVVYFDGIRLYSHDRQLITPVDPGTTGLQAHYEFESNTSDISGNGRHGTAVGNPVFVAGKLGQAISLDGIDDYVNIDGYKGILADANGVQHEFTLAAWIKTTADGEIITWGSSPGGQRMTFRVDTVIRVEHGNGNIRGTSGPDLRDNQWHHVAATLPRGARMMDVLLYVDGFDVTPNSTDEDPFVLTGDTDVSIGRRATSDDRYFTGSIDDARIYDRVLTPEEAAWLGGRTMPFDKPF